MKTITAKEAREITEMNLAGPVIEPFVLALAEQIRVVAEEGKDEFDPMHYLTNLKTLERRPTVDEERAIRNHFEQQGFCWTDHPDPDPGHPCSMPYSTLSW